jgi:hypothetical protein
MAGSFQARILSIAVVDDVLLFFFFLLVIVVVVVVVALLPAAQAAAPHYHTFPSDAVALTSGLFWPNPQQINFLRSRQQQCRVYPSLIFVSAVKIRSTIL